MSSTSFSQPACWQASPISLSNPVSVIHHWLEIIRRIHRPRSREGGKGSGRGIGDNRLEFRRLRGDWIGPSGSRRNGRTSWRSSSLGRRVTIERVCDVGRRSRNRSCCCCCYWRGRWSRRWLRKGRETSSVRCIDVSSRTWRGNSMACKIRIRGRVMNRSRFRCGVVHRCGEGKSRRGRKRWIQPSCALLI